jgi:hypothetical protein
MPPKIQRTLSEALAQLSRTEELMGEAWLLPPNFQKIAAEILLLRTATILENFLADYFRKLVCGASYIDGTQPQNFVTASSMADSEHLMLSHGRQRTSGRFMKWLLIQNIVSNVGYVIDPSDHCVVTLSRFSNEINTIRLIRNHIGHNNSGTKREYLTVVRGVYGTAARTIPCGVLLMSRSMVPGTLLKQYIVSVRVIARTLAKG